MTVKGRLKWESGVQPQKKKALLGGGGLGWPVSKKRGKCQETSAEEGRKKRFRGGGRCLGNLGGADKISVYKKCAL